VSATQRTDEAFDRLIAAVIAVLINQVCQMAVALRPRFSPSSMISRYGSQALAEVDALEG
jgi:hypothetical protein